MPRALLTGAFALLFLFPSSILNAHPGAHERIELLTARIEAAPNIQSNYIRRAQIYSDEGAYDLALADLRKAESLSEPHLVDLDFGRVYYQQGDLKTAREMLDQYLSLFPQHAKALNLRAQVRRDLDDIDGAVADYRASFDLQKAPNPGDYVAAASLLERIENDGLQSALALLDQGIEKLGLTPALQSEAIRIEAKLGRWEQAIARQETLRIMSGEGPEWSFKMGELLWKSGNPEAACNFWDTGGDQARKARQTTALKRQMTQIAARQSQCADIHSISKAE